MIFLCSGHHPEQKGASYKGVYEHDLAEEFLDCIFSKDPDNFVRVPPSTLARKVDIININNPLAAIDIHFNSCVIDGKHLGHGSEFLIYPNSNKGHQVASYLEFEFQIITHSRGVKHGYYRMDKANGVDFFLEKTSCPAVILEIDFIHRLEFIKKNKQSFCSAIINSLGRFIKAQGV